MPNPTTNTAYSGSAGPYPTGWYNPSLAILDTAQGSTVLVSVAVRFTGAEPVLSLADSSFSSWSLEQSITNGLYKTCLFRAILRGDWVAVNDESLQTITTAAVAEYAQIIDVKDQAFGPDGAIPAFAAVASSASHAVTAAATRAADLMYGCNSRHGTATAPTGITNGTQVSSIASTNIRLVSFFNNPASTSAVTTTLTYAAAQVGSIGEYALTNAPQIPRRIAATAVLRASNF